MVLNLFSGIAYTANNLGFSSILIFGGGGGGGVIECSLFVREHINGVKCMKCLSLLSISVTRKR